jgi:hypothetical protein
MPPSDMGATGTVQPASARATTRYRVEKNTPRITGVLNKYAAIKAFDG